MLNKLLIALGVLLVLVIAAILIGPGFVDWNSYKREITAKVEEATGRRLEILGDISLSLLPPTLSAEGVRFANMAGGSAPNMAALDALNIRIAPWPLLQGNLRVERIALVNPTILLEISADGRSNWAFRDGAADPSDRATLRGRAESGLDISFDKVSIENGTVIYRDARAGTERAVVNLDAEIAAETLRGPFRAAGSAVVGGDPVAFDISTGRLVEGQTAALALGLRLLEADAALRFTGGLSLQGGDGRVRGRLEGSAPSLARLLATLSGQGARGSGLAIADDQDLALSSTLDASPEAVALTDLSFRVGRTSGSGTARFVPRTPATGEITLAFNRLDLDSLLRSGAEDGAAADGAAQRNDRGGAPAFALPTDLEAEIEATVAALIYKQGLVNNLRLGARLSNGVLELDQLTALLPGGSDLAVAGTLAAAEGVPRFTGSVEASSTNFRGLLDWLRVGVPEVPSERLRNMSLVGKLSATPALVEVTDIDLRLDTSRVRGGVAIALPTGPRHRMPGFGIGLAVDQLDLDAYLPTGTLGNAPGAAPSTEGEAAETAGRVGLPLDALAPLADLAANLDLRFGTLVYNRQTVEGLHLDGTVQNGTLTLRELSVQRFAGGQGRLSGTITDLAGAPRFETTFDLTTQDAGRALALAGLSGPEPRRLGALTLGGTLSGAAEEVAYDVSFSIAGIEASGHAKGTATELGAGFPRLDTGFEVVAQDPGPLLGLAGLPAEAASRLGAMSLTGTAANVADGVSYDLALTAAGISGKAQLAGTISDLTALAPTIDARLEASVEQAAPLLALAGLQVPPEEPVGPVSLAAVAAGTTQALRLSEVTVRAGPSELTGTLALDRGGPRPRLTADLRGGEVALGWLAALGGGDGAAGSGGSGSGRSGDGRWPEAPLDLSALEALDAEIGLAADALLLGDARIEEASLALTLEQGELTVERFAGTAYGGSVEMAGRLANGAVPSATARLAATDLDLERLITQDGALAKQVRGPVSITADLRTSGLSLADMIGALEGSGDLDGTVTVLAPAEQQIGSALLGILGETVGEVRGVTDRMNALYAAFTGSPNALSGTFRIENGVLRTDDTTLAGNGAHAMATGSADLEAWELDMAVQIYRAAAGDADGSQKPVLTVDLTGPIDEPNMSLSGVALSAGLASPGEALGGVLEQLVPDREAPAEPSGGGTDAGRANEGAAEPEGRGFDALLPEILEKLRRQQQ